MIVIGEDSVISYPVIGVAYDDVDERLMADEVTRQPEYDVVCVLVLAEDCFSIVGLRPGVWPSMPTDEVICRPLQLVVDIIYMLIRLTEYGDYLILLWLGWRGVRREVCLLG